MDVKKLEKRFSRSKIRTKAGHFGQNLQYVEWPEVVRRLNAVFDGVWSFEVVEWQQRNQTLLVLGRLQAGETIKVQFGSCTLEEGLPLGEAVKAAASDALKRCAVLLGIGLHLYLGHSARQKNRTPNATVATGESVTARQERRIASLAGERGLAEGDLERQCQRWFGRPLSALTRSEASKLIDRLQDPQLNLSAA